MADASILATSDGANFFAVLADLSGTGVTTVDGDFLTPMTALIPTGFCIEYTEDTTPTSVDITWEVKVGADANEYIVREADGTAFTLSFATSAIDHFIPFIDPATGGFYDFSGVNFLKPAIVAQGGAGGASASLKITVVGRVAGARI